MINVYTLALGLWLAFSPNAQAIIFEFETIDVPLGDAQLQATLELTSNSDFNANASAFDGGLFLIDTSGSFVSLDLSYFFGGSVPSSGREFFLTADSFEVEGGPDLDTASISPNVISHSTPDIGFLGFSSGGLGDIWTIDFLTDVAPFTHATLTGRFVVVPEPGVLTLLALGMLTIGSILIIPRRNPPLQSPA